MVGLIMVGVDHGGVTSYKRQWCRSLDGGNFLYLRL